jgi:hypothetical protein
MRARVGDLAIARFDPEQEDIKAGRKWNEMVCIVTSTSSYGAKKQYREHNFIYWYNKKTSVDVVNGSLPISRLVRARPVNCAWDGNVSSLTRDMVEPVVDCCFADKRKCHVR